jgi:dTDP-4-amino-4,6-dideoxygalactose transaminase
MEYSIEVDHSLGHPPRGTAVGSVAIKGIIASPQEISASKKLAINGATPYLDAAPYEESGIATDAADAVADVVRSGRTCYWGGGPKAKEIERRFADSVGRKHGFFHSSGSSALITAVFATGADERRPVVIGSSGFVAAVNAVYHNHARPVFLPTDERTLLCTAEGYQPDLAEQPAALLVTHFLGNVVNVPVIADAVQATYVIEDAGQAHGATLAGRPVGAWSDIGSFAGSHKKLVTAGQGGLNVCDADHLMSRMRMVGNHGKAGRIVGEVPGYNFRGGEMEAVLALYALQRLEERVAARNRTAETIREVCESAGLVTARTSDDGPDVTPSWFDVGIILPTEWTPYRNWLVKALNAENIPVWSYPSLIEMPWIKPWMAGQGWWGPREEEMLARERALWGRVIVLGTQMSADDARRCTEGIVELLSGLRTG